MATIRRPFKRLNRLKQLKWFKKVIGRRSRVVRPIRLIFDVEDEVITADYSINAEEVSKDAIDDADTAPTMAILPNSADPTVPTDHPSPLSTPSHSWTCSKDEDEREGDDDFAGLPDSINSNNDNNGHNNSSGSNTKNNVNNGSTKRATQLPPSSTLMSQPPKQLDSLVRSRGQIVISPLASPSSQIITSMASSTPSLEPLAPLATLAPLSPRQALHLATQMRRGLSSHTRDRMWRFKSYKNCFKNSHAVSWALANMELILNVGAVGNVVNATNVTAVESGSAVNAASAVKSPNPASASNAVHSGKCDKTEKASSEEHHGKDERGGKDGKDVRDRHSCKQRRNSINNNHRNSSTTDHDLELLAVNRLNELIDYGLVTHVVDKTKKFKVDDNRRLYFRMVDDVIDGTVPLPGAAMGAMMGMMDPSLCSSLEKPEIISNRVVSFGNNETNDAHRGGHTPLTTLAHPHNVGEKLEEMQTQIHNLDHVLQETVQELNDVHGKLEIVHQEVISLVGQQLWMFGMVVLLFVYVVFSRVISLDYAIIIQPSSSSLDGAHFSMNGAILELLLGLFSIPGLLTIAILVLSCQCGMTCIAMYTQLDDRIIPMEKFVTDDESFADGSIVKNVRSFDRRLRATSFVKAGSGNTASDASSTPHAAHTRAALGSILRRSMRSVVGSMGGASTRSIKKLGSSIGDEKDVTYARESYSLPDVTTWPHRPLLVCVNTSVSPNLKVHQVPDGYGGLGPCPLGKPFQFSSDVFEGTCLIRLKNSNSDDISSDSAYFSGRKRIFQSVVQGRFKEEISVGDVLTGHEFARPLKNLPHPWILRTASNFIGKVAPGANVVVHTDRPLVEAILAGTSQVVRGDEPGNEPNITSINMEEDCSIFGGIFCKGNVSVSRRKRVFSNPEKAKNYTFDTDTVYTFEFYQNLFDANTYSLDLGFAKIGCSKVLDGQPIQWLGKTRDGRYLWSFQIWHEILLPEDDDQ